MVSLPGGFTMRPVANDEDVRKGSEFNAKFNNRFEGATYNCLHARHPYFSREQSLIVIDGADGEVVSTCCVIPWTLDFCGVKLRAAQLETVLTRPDCRGRGFARRQIEYLRDNLTSFGYDFSFIWGIPYFYRRFGYCYCLSAGAEEILPAPRLTGIITKKGFDLAPANEADISILNNLYGKQAGHGQIYITRDEKYWRYLITDAKHPVYIARGSSGETAGYLIYQKPDKDGGAASVSEGGFYGFDSALSALKYIADSGAGEIRVRGPADNILVRAAKSLGSAGPVPGQWLVRVGSFSSFIKKIAPALENGAEAAGFQGASRELIINLYEYAIKLVFAGGKLASAEDLGFVDYSMNSDGGDFLIPPDAFTRLLFGFGTLDSLLDAWPDIYVKPAARGFVEALFPARPSCVSAPFHYMG